MSQKNGLTYMRDLYGMSMQDLSDLIGVSKQTISKWESGKIQKVSDENTRKLVEVFKQPSKYFFCELDDEDKIRIRKNKATAELKIVEEFYIDQNDEECMSFKADMTNAQDMSEYSKVLNYRSQLGERKNNLYTPNDDFQKMMKKCCEKIANIENQRLMTYEQILFLLELIETIEEAPELENQKNQEEKELLKELIKLMNK